MCAVRDRDVIDPPAGTFFDPKRLSLAWVVRLAMSDRKLSFDLSGKVAVVTGAARGIGRAAASALAAAGADIAGIDIAGPVSITLNYAPASEADLAETGRAVETLGRRWMACKVDQRDFGALRAVAARIERELGGIDILFANAGIQAFKPILDMEDADWHDQIDVNLTGSANAVRAFGPAMVRRGGGRMILTSSTQGQHGTKSGAAYSASKWGVIGLMKSAAMDLGDYGITVNALIPGLIDTVLTRHEDRYAQAIDVAGGQPTGDERKDEDTALEGLAKKSPLGIPMIQPEDVAPMVVFLASDAACMASGGTYAVTAGDSANVQS